MFDFTLNLNQELPTNIREYKTLIDTFSKLGGVFNLILIVFRIISTYVGDFEIILTIKDNEKNARLETKYLMASTHFYLEKFFTFN